MTMPHVLANALVVQFKKSSLSVSTRRTCVYTRALTFYDSVTKSSFYVANYCQRSYGGDDASLFVGLLQASGNFTLHDFHRKG